MAARPPCLTSHDWRVARGAAASFGTLLCRTHMTTAATHKPRTTSTTRPEPVDGSPPSVVRSRPAMEPVRSGPLLPEAPSRIRAGTVTTLRQPPQRVRDELALLHHE